jgi:hypothetical protein
MKNGDRDSLIKALAELTLLINLHDGISHERALSDETAHTPGQLRARRRPSL